MWPSTHLQLSLFSSFSSWSWISNVAVSTQVLVDLIERSGGELNRGETVAAVLFDSGLSDRALG